MEEQQLRKRGWMPPGLARRQRSLKERLRSEDGAGTGRNPFFGSSKSVLSRAERKKAAAAAAEDTDGQEMLGGDDDPFGDRNGVNTHGPEELTEQEVDDFFEVERASVAPNEDKQVSYYLSFDLFSHAHRIVLGLGSSHQRTARRRTRHAMFLRPSPLLAPSGAARPSFKSLKTRSRTRLTTRPLQKSTNPTRLTPISTIYSSRLSIHFLCSWTDDTLFITSMRRSHLDCLRYPNWFSLF